MIRNIIFDFDGTLADTSEGIIAAEQVMLKRMGLPLADEAKIKAAIGLPLREALRIGGDIPEERCDEATVLYREVFDEVAYSYIKAYPEVAGTLQELKNRGIRMAIATSRGKNSLDTILQNLGIFKYFEMCVTANDNLPCKPESDMVLHILREMSISEKETLVVGDTTFDLDMGNGAGCLTCAVTYGNHTEEILLGRNPDFITGHFSDLISFISD